MDRYEFWFKQYIFNALLAPQKQAPSSPINYKSIEDNGKRSTRVAKQKSPAMRKQASFKRSTISQPSDLLSTIKVKDETEQRLLLGKIIFNLEMDRHTEQGKCIWQYKGADFLMPLIFTIMWNKELVFT